MNRSLLNKILFSTLLATIICLFTGNPTLAQNGTALSVQNSNSAILVTFAFEQITVDATAGGKTFTAATINPTVTSGIAARTRAQRADCLVETDQIRVSTNSSTTVSATVGTLVNPGQTFTIFGYTDISNLHAIRVTTNAQIDCHYSRLP